MCFDKLVFNLMKTKLKLNVNFVCIGDNGVESWDNCFVFERLKLDRPE